MLKLTTLNLKNLTMKGAHNRPEGPVGELLSVRVMTRTRLWPIVMLFAFASPAFAADSVVAIATLIPYSEKAEIRASIREECGLSAKLSKRVLVRSLKKNIPMVRLGNPSEKKPGGKAQSAQVLDLRITDAIETTGGIFPTLSLSIDGVLKEEGRVVGTFVGTRFVRASFFPFRQGECAILSEGARLLAKDVIRWMRKPVLDARLGDAH